MIRPGAGVVRAAAARWIAARPDAVRCGLRDGVSRLRDREPFWCELCSGLGAALCGVWSWAGGVPLEQHPVLGDLARLVGGHTIETLWVAFGLAQASAVLADRWPSRWIAALLMCAGWAIPVLQAAKGPADAPFLAGSCAAWVAVNAAAAWCLVRHGVRRGPPGGR